MIPNHKKYFRFAKIKSLSISNKTNSYLKSGMSNPASGNSNQLVLNSYLRFCNGWIGGWNIFCFAFKTRILAINRERYIVAGSFFHDLFITPL